jgi:hypothetical protein
VKPLAIILSDIQIGDEEGVTCATAKPGYTPLEIDGSEPLFVRDQLLSLLRDVDDVCGNGKVPYLVLNGDAWDVAICNIQHVVELSWRFFAATRIADRFEQIIFIPGNHDHYLWTMVQTQTCVVRPLERKLGTPGGVGSAVVRPFPHAACGRLTLDDGALHTFSIDGVRPPYDGNVYTTGLTGSRALPVNVVYPNLYVQRPGTGRATLITHGHFFQLGWSLMSDILRPALGSQVPRMSMMYLELLNASLTDFTNYALAQVGPLSAVFTRIYNELRSGQVPPELHRALEAIRSILDDQIAFDDDPALVARVKEFGSDRLLDLLMRIVKTAMRGALAGSRNGNLLPRGRDMAGFMRDERSRAKVEDFLTMAAPDCPSYVIDTLVFGHTHESTAGGTLRVEGTPHLAVFNSGSLVDRGHRADFLPLALYPDGSLSAFEGPLAIPAGTASLASGEATASRRRSRSRPR